MKRPGKLPFDPKVFLSKVNGGRAVSDYRKDQIVYRQGDPADCVFFIQSGKVKKTVVSEQGKEAVVALLGTGDRANIEGRHHPRDPRRAGVRRVVHRAPSGSQ